MTLAEFLEILATLPEPEKKALWEKVYHEMAVHTRKRKPTEIILARRPNEEPDIHKFRLDNWEPITYGSMNKALDRLHSIFNDLVFTFTGSDEMLQYVAKNEFTDDGYNLKVYMYKEVLKRDIEDPNGLLVWIPTGPGVTSSSEKVKPMPLLVCSSDIRYIDEENLVFVRKDYPELLVDGQPVKINEAYWHFTPTEINEVYQYELNKEVQWYGRRYYPHNMGVIPYIVLGGDKNADGYLESYFSPYCAFGNEAVRQFSDWQAIMLTSAYPFIEELATDCNAEGCIDGFLSDTETKCSKCKGMGKIIPRTPYGIYVRPMPNNLEDPQAYNALSVPSRRYITPDVAILKFSWEACEKLIEKAEDALNMVFTKQAQSGIAKELDREGQYSMISKIANNLFDNIIFKSLWFIEKYLNPKVEPQVSITKPKVFRMKSEAEIVEEIGMLKEKNAPTVFILEATRELAKKRFAGNPATEKMFDFMVRLDPMMAYTVDEKETMYASTLISKEALVLSANLYPVMIDLIEEMTPEQFLKATFEDIKKRVNEKIKVLIPDDPKPIMLPEFSDSDPEKV